MNCKLFLINMLSQNVSLSGINILLRPLMNCKLFVINMLTFSVKIILSEISILGFYERSHECHILMTFNI
jgi:hypothetical protein